VRKVRLAPNLLVYHISAMEDENPHPPQSQPQPNTEYAKEPAQLIEKPTDAALTRAGDPDPTPPSPTQRTRPASSGLPPITMADAAAASVDLHSSTSSLGVKSISLSAAALSTVENSLPGHSTGTSSTRDSSFGPRAVALANKDYPGATRGAAVASDTYIPVTRPFVREFLTSVYVDGVGTQLERALILLEAACNALQYRQLFPQLTSLDFTPPRHLDENFYENMKMCELIVAISRSGTMELIEESAAENMENAAQIALSVMEEFVETQGFHDTLIFESMNLCLPYERMRRRRRQARNKENAELEKELQKVIVNHPGSVTAKYETLLRQHRTRRQELATLGQVKGRMNRKLGYPQLFYDFAANETDPNGFNMDIRLRFAPVIYDLTSFAALLRTLAELIRRRLEDTGAKDQAALAQKANYETKTLYEAVDVYAIECKKLLSFMRDTFSTLPLFITKDDAVNAEKSDYLRLCVEREPIRKGILGPGEEFSVTMDVEISKTVVVWQVRASSMLDSVSVTVTDFDGQVLEVSKSDARATDGSFMEFGQVQVDTIGEYTFCILNECPSDQDPIGLAYRVAMVQPREDRQSEVSVWVDQMVNNVMARSTVPQEPALVR